MEQLELVIRNNHAVKELIDSYEEQGRQYTEAVADTINALSTMLKNDQKKALLQLAKNLQLRWSVIETEAWARRAKLTKYKQRGSYDYNRKQDVYEEE